MQGSNLVLWAMLNADDTIAKVIWDIQITSTGHAIGSAWTRDHYVYSFYSGDLVLHAFAKADNTHIAPSQGES